MSATITEQAESGASSPTTNQARWFFSNLVRVRLDGSESDGSLDVVEGLGARGEMPPLHIHHREDEYFVVLEGELSLHTPGASRRVAAGEAAYAPRGVPHVYRVESERARWLGISNPSGFASFVLAASDPAEAEELPPADRPVDFDRLGAAADAHGIEILGPPGTMPG